MIDASVPAPDQGIDVADAGLVPGVEAEVVVTTAAGIAPRIRRGIGAEKKVLKGSLKTETDPEIGTEINRGSKIARRKSVPMRVLMANRNTAPRSVKQEKSKGQNIFGIRAVDVLLFNLTSGALVLVLDLEKKIPAAR